MANSERSRMLELGQWLQDYLNPGITAKGYRKLAQDFIRLYNVDFKISKDDITIRIFELKEKFKADEIQIVESIRAILKVDDKHRLEFSFDDVRRDDPIIDEICKICEKNKPYFPDSAPNDVITGSYMIRALWMLEVISDFIETKQKFSNFLRDITKSKTTWYPQLLDNDEYAYLTILLRGKYNCLAEEATLLPTEVKKNTVFREHVKAISKAPCFEKWLPFFPWPAATAKVFFDFLIAGGQDHFKFCDYCGAFTVIRRKASKKFCSDRCRAQYRHDEIAKSQ